MVIKYIEENFQDQVPSNLLLFSGISFRPLFILLLSHLKYFFLIQQEFRKAKILRHHLNFFLSFVLSFFLKFKRICYYSDFTLKMYQAVSVVTRDQTSLIPEANTVGCHLCPIYFALDIFYGNYDIVKRKLFRLKHK